MQAHLEARTAHLVNSSATDAGVQARQQGCLQRGCLPHARTKHVAKKTFLHGIGVDTRILEHTTNCKYTSTTQYFIHMNGVACTVLIRVLACAPSSGADKEASAPPNDPIGVRQAATMQQSLSANDA